MDDMLDQFSPLSYRKLHLVKSLTVDCALLLFIADGTYGILVGAGGIKSNVTIKVLEKSCIDA